MADGLSLSDFIDPAARRLAEAVAHDDVGRALALAHEVKGGVNVVGKNGNTPLLIAAYRNNPAMVKALLKAGAHPNGGPDSAPLHEAVKARDLVVARLLLKAGADPNGHLDDETALFEAALLGDPPRAELLLAAGARVDGRDSLGSTPSLEAASADNWRMVLTLLHHGGSPLVASQAGLTLGDFAFHSLVAPSELEGPAKAQVEEILKRAGSPWPPPAPPQVRALVAAGHWPPVHR